MLGWLIGGSCSITALTHDRACRDAEPGHVLLTRGIGELIGMGIGRLDMHTAEGYKTHYLRQRRMRLDPLVLCPPGLSQDLALAGMFGVAALRQRVKALVTRRSKSQTEHERN
jgi:CelD/BcsL family acetyltransferase involved in cellulose biosynthesis